MRYREYERKPWPVFGSLENTVMPFQPEQKNGIVYRFTKHFQRRCFFPVQIVDRSPHEGARIPERAQDKARIIHSVQIEQLLDVHGVLAYLFQKDLPAFALELLRGSREAGSVGGVARARQAAFAYT